MKRRGFNGMVRVESERIGTGQRIATLRSPVSDLALTVVHQFAVGRSQADDAAGLVARPAFPRESGLNSLRILILSSCKMPFLSLPTLQNAAEHIACAGEAKDSLASRRKERAVRLKKSRTDRHLHQG